MITTLKILFLSILGVMIAGTTYASLGENVVTAFVRIVKDPWGAMTMFDAYFGFITFYAWVFYRESSVLSRGVWFLSIMAFGNIAMSIYVLIILFSLPEGATASEILLRKENK